MDPFLLLIILGTVIFLGVVGEIFFKKTGIPDLIWLVIFGLIIKYFLGINITAYSSVLPVFMALTIIIILFEGGLHLDIIKLVKFTAKGFSLALLSFIFSVLLVGIGSYFLYIIGVLKEWSFLSGIILGSIVGGLSSIIVIPLVKKAKLEEDILNILSIESAFTDALCVVVTLTLVQYISFSQPLTVLGKNIAASFSTATLVGFIAGFFWLNVLEKLKKYSLGEYSYVLTISLLIFLYSFVENIGGSGVISTFVFGLVLGNTNIVNKLFSIIGVKKEVKLDKEIMIINKQLSFLIKSFFFVLIGLLLVLEVKYLFVSFLVMGFLLIGRVLAVNTIPQIRKLKREEKKLLYFFIPKGLAAGVLAIDIMKYSIPGKEIISNVTLIIILLSVLVSTVAMFVYKRNEKKLKKTS